MGALAGCGGNSQTTGTPAPTDSAAPTAFAAGNILRWGTDSEPTGFDPHTNSE